MIRLVEEDVLKMRRLYADGTSSSVIHKEHFPESSYAAIKNAIAGRTWSHLPGIPERTELEKQIGPKFKDITGKRFGMLRVLGLHDRIGSHFRWLCKCDCGGVSIPIAANLNKGHSTSCGCLVEAHRKSSDPIHGGVGTPEYKIYAGAKARCNNPNNKRYARYGGRGIKMLYADFGEFIKDIGERPSPKHTIDRIDNDSHYMPGNVRWATMAEQNQNQSTTKLNWDEVKKIRQMFAKGMSPVEIWKSGYRNMTLDNIKRVVKQQTWKEVA